MKKQYSFLHGERGKFYHPQSSVRIPVYLDPQVQKYLSTKAKRKGVDLNELVNDLLKKEITIIESVA